MNFNINIIEDKNIYQTVDTCLSLASVLSEEGGGTVRVVVADLLAEAHTVAFLTAGANMKIFPATGAPDFATLFSLDDFLSPEREISTSPLVHEVSLGHSTGSVKSAVSINIFSKCKKGTGFSRPRFLCNVILEINQLSKSKDEV